MARGREALDWAERAGIVLDDWQKLCLLCGCRTHRSRWAAFEVGINVPRQNGKGGVLEVREGAGLYCFGERMVTHSAHQFDTSLEAFRRLLALIEDTPELDREVKRVSYSHGEEGIELTGGRRIRFRTRTKGGGRGFSSDCLILDEAMFLPEFSFGALLPILSARPHPQVWYTGSAVDREIHEHGLVFSRIRARGIAGGDPSLVYLEWSAEAELETVVEVLDDPAAWREANPALGIRITTDHVANERRALDARTFAVERLGVGDWPSLEAAETVIDLERWHSLADPSSRFEGPLVLAFDVTPSRSRAAIVAAGRRPDGLLHVETIEHRNKTDWLPQRLAELVRTHPVEAVVYDTASPAAALVDKLAALGLEPERTTAREYADACGAFYDAVEDGELRHLGTPELTAAIRNASKRSLGEAWAWSRRRSAGDISPLVAATLALWRSARERPSSWDERGLVAV